MVIYKWSKVGCRFETQNFIWQKKSLVTRFSSSKALGLTDEQQTFNIDTTRNSIIHWYYTSWALTYLTFLNYLPIIAQYFTQRGFCMNSDYFPRIPLSQQVSCSSLKRVRWSVTKTPTLCLKSIELGALREPHQAEGPCLSLRKS